MQDVTFRPLKGGFLACEKPPFRAWKAAFWKPKGIILIIKWLQRREREVPDGGGNRADFAVKKAKKPNRFLRIQTGNGAQTN